jgi:hypothetical protein
MEPMAGIERPDCPLISDASPLLPSRSQQHQQRQRVRLVARQGVRGCRHALLTTPFSSRLLEVTKPRRGKFNGFLIKRREVCNIALSDGAVVLYQSIMISDEFFSNPVYSNEYTHGRESILSITEANSMQRTRKSRLMGSLFVTFRLVFLI